MRTQLLTVTLLAIGLQGCAISNNGPEGQAVANATMHQLANGDEIWGTGKRAVQPDTFGGSALHATVGETEPHHLEAAFWFCDYVASTRGVEATPIALCSAAYDELKTVKFGGDFGALLDWWKENKMVEHGRIASAAAQAAVQY